MEAIAPAGAALVDEPGAETPSRPSVDFQLARWIRGRKGGDVAAFEELMSLHERRVYGTAWRLLGRVEDGPLLDGVAIAGAYPLQATGNPPESKSGETAAGATAATR